MNEFLSNKKLALRIIIFLLFLSLFAGILFSLLIKEIALTNLAQNDAKQRSEFIFEIMMVKMQEGWGKKDLEKIINRLNRMHKGLTIKSYRSRKVAEIFGEYKDEKRVVESDSLIKKAMNGEEVFYINNDGSEVRFIYPIKVKKECISCHYNTKIGDVNGVLDIKFSSDDISIPLNQMITYFLIFLLIFIIIIFAVFYYVITKKMVDPITRFTQKMEQIAQSNKIDQNITIDSKILEIRKMVAVFNHLISRIRFYYDKSIKNSYTDTLTGLPNFMALRDYLKDIDSPTAVLFNIDRLKDLNDFYGYEVGDFVICSLAERIVESIDESGKVFRLGGDEIVWIKEGDIDLFELLELLEKINYEPIDYEGGEIYISVHCGIGKGKKRLIEKASIALQLAKDNNRPIEFMSDKDENEGKNELYRDRLEWTKKLKEAFEDDRILTYFQPILEVGLDKPRKFETLVRIKGEDGTIYSPGEFMSAAKHSRLYLKMTRTIVLKAMTYMREKPYEFSLNLSMEDIADLPTKNYILELLKSFPEPNRVIFEILETEEIDEFDLISEFIKEAKEIGAKIAIDDFGSGYSNYNYVIRLNIDYIKIDSSLIRNISKDKNSKVVVESIVWTAHQLGLKTIAEYVDSKEIMEEVKNMGIDFIQGYYIGKPMENIESI
ncbi:EAL domain-containing protein [Hydrogenimonas thermophila]|uniref:Diguanylate cyclase (GGDEF) domain-containing protein n=1 Tax=Hydrogenimonas thermophila TaxID=223786 RepID=A0A1I5M571_9BACT|nr:EAL domain-containing protein [Hydrogenimonas thermophila]WOE70546.1 EAL domain-containing protein [Hydrogenimonas thermophila]WOE73062.1 EAL domain-containing protein [Hydrogenimonas thermophila]SFP04467.1 diguanylate cyclase (GGDEF) domain-containing protein [Hydrogenimonas thermophila]